MSPRELVELWVERFNAADVDGLAELYQLDAVNHQVAQEPVRGRDAIRAMFAQELSNAEMTCIVEMIHEAGEVAIFEWRDPLGLRMRVLHRARWADRLPAWLLGQAFVPEDARAAHGVPATARDRWPAQPPTGPSSGPGRKAPPNPASVRPVPPRHRPIP
jgi:hypothetical protein